MQQISYKLPFQLDGQDAWVNNDAQELSQAGTPFGSGASYDWYVGNGPCGQATQLWSGASWQNSGWWTASTAADRWKWAHDAAGLPHTPLPVCPTAGLPAPAQSLQDWLGGTLYSLLTQPAPPSNLRGLILAKTQLWVPEEVTDVVGWLEQNRPVAPTQTVKVKATARTGTAHPYRLEASRTQRVYGRCIYSATENQTQSYRLSEAELAEIIDGATDQQEALEFLQNWLNNGDWDIDSEDDCEYEDHEIQDYGDTDDEEDNAEEILAQFFADHPEHDPEREEDDEEEEVEETPVLTELRGFYVGQRVRVTYGGLSVPEGSVGTICQLRRPDTLGVEFSGLLDFVGHDCDGHCPAGCGWFISTCFVEPVLETVTRPADIF